MWGMPSLPRSNSFSSRRASLLSRRSCLSISSLIRRASFASSLRQHAMMDSRVILYPFFFLSLNTNNPAFSPSYWVIQDFTFVGEWGVKTRGLWMSNNVLIQACFLGVKTRLTRSRLRWRREYFIISEFTDLLLFVPCFGSLYGPFSKQYKSCLGVKAVSRLYMINRSL